MHSPARVEFLPLNSSQAGSTLFSSPQPSDETLIATVGTTPAHELFCHRKQTDQLLLLQGAVDLVVLHNKQLHTIAMRVENACWVRIPPGIPHGAINRGASAALMVNAVQRHGEPDARDYRPLPIPMSLQQDWISLVNGPA
jgi:hypothetical protein